MRSFFRELGDFVYRVAIVVVGVWISIAILGWIIDSGT